MLYMDISAGVLHSDRLGLVSVGRDQRDRDIVLGIGGYNRSSKV